jgi:hypothetical protein
VHQNSYLVSPIHVWIYYLHHKATYSTQSKTIAAEGEKFPEIRVLFELLFHVLFSGLIHPSNPVSRLIHFLLPNFQDFNIISIISSTDVNITISFLNTCRTTSTNVAKSWSRVNIAISNASVPEPSSFTIIT